jgi:hypothetical protein
MSYKDLRIGSYVHPIMLEHRDEVVRDDIYLKVSQVSAGKVSVDSPRPDYRDFATVILTPELFKKLGFVKTDFAGHPNVKGVMWRKLLDNCVVDIEQDSATLNLSFHIPAILYLHEWQNLHKVLTGKEVEISL